MNWDCFSFEVADELMDAHDDRLTEEARGVAVELMPMDAQTECGRFCGKSARHVVSHSVGAHPHVVQAAREYRCDGWRDVERDPIRDHEQLMFAMFQATLSAGTVSFGNTRTLEKSSCVSSSWTNGRVALC